MKLILKDKTEIVISNVNVSYNDTVDMDERNSILLTINNPEVEVADLAKALTADNLSSVQIESNVKTVSKENLKLSTISEVLTDDTHAINIRLH